MIFLYLSVIFICSIFFGTLINSFKDYLNFPWYCADSNYTTQLTCEAAGAEWVVENSMHSHSGGAWDIFSDISVILMILTILYSIINSIIKPAKKKVTTNEKVADLSLIVKGMTCNHCKETATEAIKSCEGIEKVVIDLETGNTLIYGQSINEKEIIESINSVGFSASKLG